MGILKNLKRLKIFMNLSYNIIMLLQIILIILLLLVSTYLFLNLLDVKLFDFVKPLAEFARSFIKMFFHDSIKPSQPGIDGELIAFLMLVAIVIFVLVQIRIAIKCYIEELDKKIVEVKISLEEKFNKDLREDLGRSILQYNNWMLGIIFKVAPLFADSMKIYGEAKVDTEKILEDVQTTFLSEIKDIPGMKLQNENGVFLITSSKYEYIDRILDAVQDTISRLKKECKSQKTLLKPRLAIETYKSLTSRSVVQTSIKSLLDLNLGGDPLCFGNFRNRHAMFKKSHYTVVVKGQYDIKNVKETIYALVKKS